MGTEPLLLFLGVIMATFLLSPFDARPIVRLHRLDWGLLRRGNWGRIHLRSDNQSGNRLQVLEIYREQLSKLCLPLELDKISKWEQPKTHLRVGTKKPVRSWM